MDFFNSPEHLSRDSGILRLMNDLGGALGDANIQMLGGGNPAAISEVERVFRAEMQKLLADGNTFERMLGDYDPPQGNDAFIDALAVMLSRELNANITRENIAVTNGSQSAFSALFNLFTGRGKGGAHKKILLPMTPEYIGYAGLGPGRRPAITSLRARIDDLGETEFKYRIDFDRLSIGRNIGAVCVSRPSNPSGNLIGDAELDDLRKMTRAAKVPLIVDGAYGPPFPGIIFAPAAPCWDDDMIFCLSLSKLGMPGARTGIVIANAEIIARITQANAVHALAPGRFGPTLVTRLIASGELPALCAEKIMPYYRARAQLALELLREHLIAPGIPLRVHASQGAIFLWLWFPKLLISSDELYRRLKKRGVLVIAGEHFFPGLRRDWRHSRECIRITYASDAAQLRRGIEILGEEARRAYRRG